MLLHCQHSACVRVQRILHEVHNRQPRTEQGQQRRISFSVTDRTRTALLPEITECILRNMSRPVAIQSSDSN